MKDKKKITRSEFTKEGFKSILKYVSNIDSKIDKIKNIIDESLNYNINNEPSGNIPQLRPPGAIEEDLFLKTCTGCNDCADACAYNSIIKTNNEIEKTPVIESADSPCYMCEDFPCIKSCKTGALVHNKNKIKIGSAYIIKNKCFANNGQICDYCYDRCPEKGKAIIMQDDKPIIITENCTGCGICRYYCPAPGKGIIVLPVIEKQNFIYKKENK